jgi:hypothetical protein
MSSIYYFEDSHVPDYILDTFQQIHHFQVLPVILIASDVFTNSQVSLSPMACAARWTPLLAKHTAQNYIVSLVSTRKELQSS